MNQDISQLQISTPLSPHRRRLVLAVIDIFRATNESMEKRARLRYQRDQESSKHDDESARSNEKCAWRTRDREHHLLRQEGQRRLKRWTEDQDQIFERFYGGDGSRARTARHAYAAVPPNTVLPPCPRWVDVERRSRRRMIRKRRVGEARFGVTSSFDMDELRARGGLVGVKPVLGARPLLSPRPVGEGRPGR
ncbi:hypothetical protein V499_01076 [Pseudogymnoascus sp. VKM F-103]|nr:hypothetical protein V499_01076 [Pseudogymnoascus sp. VKM F-103]